MLLIQLLMRWLEFINQFPKYIHNYLANILKNRLLVNSVIRYIISSPQQKLAYLTIIFNFYSLSSCIESIEKIKSYSNRLHSISQCDIPRKYVLMS